MVSELYLGKLISMAAAHMTCTANRIAFITETKIPNIKHYVIVFCLQQKCGSQGEDDYLFSDGYLECNVEGLK